MSFFRKKITPDKEQPVRSRPEHAGAYLFTLRSVPRHYAPLKRAIESSGEARIYFDEPLAYIRGKGIALFRIEATGFDWIAELQRIWADLEYNEAFEFDIYLYVYDKELIGSLRNRTSEEIAAWIRDNAPTVQGSSV